MKFIPVIYMRATPTTNIFRYSIYPKLAQFDITYILNQFSSGEPEPDTKDDIAEDLERWFIQTTCLQKQLTVARV